MEKVIIKKNREVILNRAKDYYENNNKLLRERAKNKDRELSGEKNIKREYGKNRYHNMSEEKKQKLKEYQKNYREAKQLKIINEPLFSYIITSLRIEI